MAALGENVGLLFKIKADSSDAVRDINKVQSEVGGLGSGFAGLAGPAAIAGAAVAGVTVAAVAAGKALFNLTAEAAKYGSEIFDATQKTGLAAETISSIKVAADQSGTSLEAVTAGLGKFAKTIGDAEGGSDKAQASLKKLNVTSKDLDTALGQALTTIAKYPPGVQQMTAAQAAFGRSGADLLPFIKSFDGNLPGLIAKCKELGLTMSDSDARAADEFGDQMDILDAQMAAVGRTIGFELMPVFMDMATYMSKWLADNQGEIRSWGTDTADILRGVASYWRDATTAAAEYFPYTPAGMAYKHLLGGNDKSFSEIYQAYVPAGIIYKALLNRGQQERAKGEPNIVMGDPGTYTPAPRSRVDLSGRRPLITEDGRKARDKERDDARKRAEDIAKRDLNAGIAAQKNILGFQSKDDIEESLDDMIEKLKKFGTSDVQVSLIAADFNRLEDNIKLTLEALKKLEDQKRATNTTEENALLTQEQSIREDEALAKVEKARAEFNDAVAKQNKDDEEAAAKRLQTEIDKTKELMDIEEERAKRELASPGIQKPPMDTEGMTGGDDYNFDIGGSWKEFKDSVLEDGPRVTQVLTQIGDIGFNAMKTLAQGIGQLVENWVLMGSTGPNAMRKMVASVLAGVAAQATVLAIFELAKGFASLFWNPAEAAAHFKAAALFGVAAAAAGGAGRAVAGNAFQQQTGGASASGGGGQGDRPEDRFTEDFNGFGGRERGNNFISKLEAAFGIHLERTRVVMGGVEEQLNRFNQRFGLATPGQVVMAGAGEAGQAIFDAHTSILGNGGGATETVRRNMGI